MKAISAVQMSKQATIREPLPLMWLEALGSTLGMGLV
jgi:hypothetical protein